MSNSGCAVPDTLPAPRGLLPGAGTGIRGWPHALSYLEGIGDRVREVTAPWGQGKRAEGTGNSPGAPLHAKGAPKSWLCSKSLLSPKTGKNQPRGVGDVAVRGRGVLGHLEMNPMAAGGGI